jgi:PAS domain S-box-containing protein
MTKPLNILIVEDAEDDALLLLRELRRAGFDPVSERVETAEDMKAALGQRPWDVVISDYLMPKFSGLAALDVLRESGLDLPFIIVSGNIGEDIAVNAMKAGAHDYIIKGNLARLIPAVERELRDAEMRRDRGRAEEQLRASRQKLFVTLENMNEGFFTLDNEWRFTYVNAEASNLWGIKREELLGRSLWEVAPAAVGTIYDEQYHKAVRERVPVKFEAMSPLLGAWVEARAYPGEEGLAVYFHDISERKQAEEKISRLNRLYSVLSKVNETIIRVHDAHELYRQVCRIAVEEGSFKMAWIGSIDPETRRVVPVASHGDDGYLKDLVILAADVPEGKGPTVRAAFEGTSVMCGDIEHDDCMLPWRDKALRHGLRASAAFPLRSGSAITSVFNIYGSTPQSFTDEEIALLSSLAEDVSFAIDNLAKEKQRQEAERRTEVTNALLSLYTRKLDRKEYLEAAIELIRSWSGCRSAGMREADREGNIPYVACAGFDSAFIESEDRVSLTRDHCACTRVVAGEPDPLDAAAMTPNGSLYYNDAVAFMNDLPPEQKTRFRGVCQRSGFSSIAVIPVRHRDRVLGALHLADERKGVFPLQTVEFLERIALIIGETLGRFSVEEEQVRLASALESSADAVVITEPSAGAILYVNRAFEQITGYTKEEALGRTVHFLETGRHPEEFYRELRETLRRSGVWRGQFMNRKKDGSLYFEDCTFSPVRDEAGQVINFISVRRDVTEKLRLESIAESVNTMNSIGYVFSGVRHEIGNPINSAKMSLSVLQHKLDTASKEAVRGYVDRALSEIGRVEQLLKNLRNYNLYETPELADLDMSAFLEKFLKLISEDFEKKGIAITRVVRPDAPWAVADPRALQQVLLNIITNAGDALAGCAAPAITISVTRKFGRVLLQITDNGCGMTEQQLQDLFKPFYTSKHHGTGLGLVIVKKMLTRMNGEIELTSLPGRGTTVHITLPEGTNGRTP